MREYSLVELQKLATPALRHAELVELASNQSPNRTYELAVSRWPRRQATAARFLAILRRDHGAKAMKALITSVEHARPQGTEHAQGDHMTALTVPQFLYPTSRQFPFDGVCEMIVRALEERNWQVPGITVEFDEYGSGAQKYRMVRYIRSEDYQLHFGREQGSLPGRRWNNTAAISEIVIPKKELHVYQSEDGPTFYLYVGNNWARDRENFMHGIKVNSRLNGEPRTYLKYKGGCDCGYTAAASFEAVGFLMATLTGDRQKLAAIRHTHPGRRSPLLVHDNDLGREYDPVRGKWNWREWRREPDDPTCLNTADVFTEFEQYLEQVVLAQIVAHPIPSERIEVLGAATVPFSPLAILGEIYCFADDEEAERIKQGKLDPSHLEAADRYAMHGSGYRLVSYDVPDDGTLPKVAYEGFLWCGIVSTLIEVPTASLTIPGHDRREREEYVVHIRPNRANDIYIADHAPYEKRREEIWKAVELEGRDRLTDGEVADFLRARGRTIVPISEYKGGFEKPVVLINRELGFDEVEIASEPRVLARRRRRG